MEEKTTRRDALATIDLVVRMISVVLIPIVIVLIGNTYNRQQKELEQMRSNNENTANRLTSLLKNFASDNPRERKLAVIIATYLAEKNQLPGELVRVLALIAESDTNKDVSNTAYLSLQTVAVAGKEQSPEASAIIKEMPGRVYVQVPDRNQMVLARQIHSLLAGKGYQLPPVEIVNAPVRSSQVRYFHTTDRVEAEKLAGSLGEVVQRITPLFVRGYEERVRQRQFEIWIAGN